ncbi:MAG: M20/M25/M40 family metallo-hydrolase, partial [Euryarchaeota archaeon]|nr:M20/M25/M40 family metallo-hydrolase [Euryarchaeota archaeon]
EVRTGPGKYLFTDPNSTLPRAAVEVLEELGIRAYPIEAAGASDSRYFTPFDVECIDFGPIGGNVHGPNEWVDVQSLMLLPTFYKNLALRIMNTELK